MKEKDWIQPGYFSNTVSADILRGDFDVKNQVIIQNGIAVQAVFIGDSITQMWELNAYFSGRNGIIANRGIGGDVTEYLSKRFAADALQLKPCVIILLIGINDAWNLEYDSWKQQEGSNIKVVLQKAKENLAAISAQAKTMGIRLAMCSILPCNMVFNNAENQRQQYILDINQEMAQLAKRNGQIYVDYYSHMVECGSNKVQDGLTKEGLHPNVFGYNIMAKVLRDTLKQNVISI